MFFSRECVTARTDTVVLGLDPDPEAKKGEIKPVPEVKTWAGSVKVRIFRNTAQCGLLHTPEANTQNLSNVSNVHPSNTFACYTIMYTVQ